MRPSCLNCVRKHLAKAEINLTEWKLGYPSRYYWMCMGQMSEAEDEAIRDYPDLAKEIRNERKLLEDDPAYEIPLLDLIDVVTAVAEEEESSDVKRKGSKASTGSVRKGRR